jgi:hypothetical protein
MSDENQAGQDAPVVVNEAQNPEAMPENVAALPDETQAPEDVKTEAETKTFTQAELNEIIQKEKAKAEAKAERRALKAYRETLERFAQQQPVQPQQTEDYRPSRANYATDDDWVEAVTDWKLQQRDREFNNQRQQAQAKTVAEKTESFYAEAQKIAGFDREAFDELPLTPAIANALIGSDVAAKLMVHMAAHPDEVERIAGLSPARQAAEIGKLETKLSSSATKASNAPPPIKPIGSRGSSSNTDPSRMTMEEYNAMRKAQGARWAR